ncbi:MAG: beta-lactamase family protein [Candidatus Marinimicrobia bacterium]|nr:beta-lactamase family protein [Candidatus Neomarinimicrobiota bacterium]
MLGPFPANPVDTILPDGSRNTGYQQDYLEKIGGEENIVIADTTIVNFQNEQGHQLSRKAEFIQSKKNGIIDLDKRFNKIDHCMSYAFCYIQSRKDQKVNFLFGSDDGAKIWINGNLIYRNYDGRSLVLRQDHFSTSLKKGLNRVLIKVVDLVGDWGFILEPFDSAAWSEYQISKKLEEDKTDFLNCKIKRDDNYWNYLFTLGEFLDLEWEAPYLVKKVAGDFLLKIKWYDKNLKQVEKPVEPGRYGYYIEGQSPRGFTIRRGGTMYCLPSGWLAWSERPKAYLSPLPLKTVSDSIWHKYEDIIAQSAGRVVLLSILQQEEGAVLLSYLDEINEDEEPSRINTPIIQDHEYHLALKKKILDYQNTFPALDKPEEIAKPAKRLSPGSLEKADVKKGIIAKLDTACQSWYSESGEPFEIVAARHGVIFYDQAFGKNVNRQTKMPMASLTKFITGVMFAQFVDQGLINIDDPVGKFLPDFPRQGKNAVTLRHCFTHTAGLYGHEEYGGLHNPWLENVIANGYELGLFQPGKKHNYTGMGYDLAGRVMEMVSDKSIFRLFQENFFLPLGLDNTILEEDLGFSCNSTARDMATVGQLMLNKGKYGNKIFFSESTFRKLLPKNLNQYYPGIDEQWGIGITWMRDTHPETGTGRIPADSTIFSKRTFGHGSATSAVLRIDPQNDLVLAINRRYAGENYQKHLKNVEMIIANHLK